MKDNNTQDDHTTIKLQKPELRQLLEKGERTQLIMEDGELTDEKVTIELTEDVETEKVETWRIEE